MPPKTNVELNIFIAHLQHIRLSFVINAQNKSAFSDLEGNKLSSTSHVVTKLIQISSKQKTELLAIFSDQNPLEQDLFSLASSDSCTFPVVKVGAPAAMKPSNIGNVMVILSSLPGVVAGDEFRLKATSYLVTSKPAREFVGCETISPELRIK